jgi:hypothetical protein
MNRGPLPTDAAGGCRPSRSAVYGDAQVRLLAVMDHTSCVAIGQTDLDATTKEIARFRLLLDPLDLTGMVLTAR